jgi:RelA/SpoT family (p)ppGpp synthetase
MNKTSKYQDYFDISEVAQKALEYQPNFNTEKFIEAFHFADEAHTGQMRKDGTSPYIVHPIKVVENLMKIHADEDVLIAALLHDVPEDTSRTIEEIEIKFGKTIAFLVEGITKLSKVHYRNAMPARQVESLKKLLLHSAKDPRIILIKLADRLHNMQTLTHVKDPSKRLRIARETLEIYVPMANLLGIQDIKTKLEDLCFKHIFPTEYSQINRRIKFLERSRQNKTKRTIQSIKDLLEKDKVQAETYERKKVLYRIYLKMSISGITIDQLENRIPLRIIVDTIPQCYQVLGIIHSHFNPKINKFRDYIANPKANGYQSIHTSIFGPEKLLTEIQIRTKQMDIESAYGIASNYWNNSPDQKSVINDKRSKWVARIVEVEKGLNKNEEFLENIKDDILKNRIFVYTPQGRGIDLPEGATIIDFAYAIHTDIGNHALRASVNGNNMPITTELKTNDIVKIITSPTTSPDIFWLSFAKTNFAKKNIKQQLKKANRKEKINKGKVRLQKELDLNGLGLLKDINIKKLLRSIAESHIAKKKISSLEDILICISEGEIRASEITSLIKKTKQATDEKKNHGIMVNIKIIGQNRLQLLREIADVIYRHSLDMEYLKGWTDKNNSAFFSSRIRIHDTQATRHLFDELEQIRGVTTVYRASKKGLIISALISSVTFIAWIVHPLIIRMLIETTLGQNRLALNIIINAGIIGLLLLVIVSTSTIQKYFPLIRNKKRLWLIVFSVPALAMLVLITEMLYFDLNLSLMTIFIEATIIYSYLVFSFINFRRHTK